MYICALQVGCLRVSMEQELTGLDMSKHGNMAAYIDGLIGQDANDNLNKSTEFTTGEDSTR